MLKKCERKITGPWNFIKTTEKFVYTMKNRLNIRKTVEYF